MSKEIEYVEVPCEICGNPKKVKKKDYLFGKKWGRKFHHPECYLDSRRGKKWGVL
jgi:hypothetical protein